MLQQIQEALLDFFQLSLEADSRFAQIGFQDAVAGRERRIADDLGSGKDVISIAEVYI